MKYRFVFTCRVLYLQLYSPAVSAANCASRSGVGAPRRSASERVLKSAVPVDEAGVHVPSRRGDVLPEMHVKSL